MPKKKRFVVGESQPTLAQFMRPMLSRPRTPQNAAGSSKASAIDLSSPSPPTSSPKRLLSASKSKKRKPPPRRSAPGPSGESDDDEWLPQAKKRKRASAPNRIYRGDYESSPFESDPQNPVAGLYTPPPTTSQRQLRSPSSHQASFALPVSPIDPPLPSRTPSPVPHPPSSQDRKDYDDPLKRNTPSINDLQSLCLASSPQPSGSGLHMSDNDQLEDSMEDDIIPSSQTQMLDFRIVHRVSKVRKKVRNDDVLDETENHPPIISPQKKKIATPSPSPSPLQSPQRIRSLDESPRLLYRTPSPPPAPASQSTEISVTNQPVTPSQRSASYIPSSQTPETLRITDTILLLPMRPLGAIQPAPRLEKASQRVSFAEPQFLSPPVRRSSSPENDDTPSQRRLRGATSSQARADPSTQSGSQTQLHTLREEPANDIQAVESTPSEDGYISADEDSAHSSRIKTVGSPSKGKQEYRLAPQSLYEYDTLDEDMDTIFKRPGNPASAMHPRPSLLDAFAAAKEEPDEDDQQPIVLSPVRLSFDDTEFPSQSGAHSHATIRRRGFPSHEYRLASHSLYEPESLDVPAPTNPRTLLSLKQPFLPKSASPSRNTSTSVKEQAKEKLSRSKSPVRVATGHRPAPSPQQSRSSLRSESDAGSHTSSSAASQAELPSDIRRMLSDSWDKDEWDDFNSSQFSQI
ncbi:hypothetical protein DL93DRAFT_2233358 [Clavulina sp. PMI_390]|nr:hypothetical protein DL93DRAFT_2233358 [Clavulina sp. PMI_390]